MENLRDQAISLFREKKYDEALPIAQEALHKAIEINGSVHSDVAKCMHDLGTLYAVMGRNGEAEKWYEQSRTIWEQDLGSDFEYVGWCLEDQALFYYRLKRDEEALTMRMQAVDILEFALGPDDPGVRMLVRYVEMYGG